MPPEKRFVTYIIISSSGSSFTSRWLHALYLAIDANFRLKLKARGIEDPELGSGWAYFVEQTDYEKHLRKHFDDKEVCFILLY